MIVSAICVVQLANHIVTKDSVVHVQVIVFVDQIRTVVAYALTEIAQIPTSRARQTDAIKQTECAMNVLTLKIVIVTPNVVLDVDLTTHVSH